MRAQARGALSEEFSLVFSGHSLRGTMQEANGLQGGRVSISLSLIGLHVLLMLHLVALRQDKRQR